jgi:hypothetical protein
LLDRAGVERETKFGVWFVRVGVRGSIEEGGGRSGGKGCRGEEVEDRRTLGSRILLDAMDDFLETVSTDEGSVSVSEEAEYDAKLNP